MDLNHAVQCLMEIGNGLPDGYPEMQVLLFHSILPGGELNGSLEDIVGALQKADGTKVFPPKVADFLIEYYTDEINAGNYEAANDLGVLCYTGRMGGRDYKTAVEYYQLAADHGCRQAQENLGYCYYYGRDVEIDYEKAFHYFALGAFDGHLRSLYKIGDMYRNGYYVKKNPEEAFLIYEHCMQTLTDEAIPAVGADIFMRMGDCFSSGIGTEKNLELAMMFYQRSELLFYKRLNEGDYLIRNCYSHVLDQQEEIRKEMQGLLPDFDWTE